MTNGGRPSSYDPGYCDAVVEFGREGESLTGIAVKLGVSKQTVYNWMDEFPDFMDAIEKARACAQGWWEDTLKFQARSGKGSATAAIFAMKNQFPDDYRDRREIDLDGKIGVFEIDFTGYDEDTEDSTEEE